MTIIQDLKRYYNEVGISATKFRCEHLSDCKRDCTNFTTAIEAYVGSKYGQGKVPRLLFLSLDSGGGEADPEARTMEACRVREETSCDVNRLPKNRHWYRTHELAYVLLKDFLPAAELDPQPLTISPSIHFYFAHTNSAKCCMNKDNQKMADWQMFKNCRQYIAGELSALRPAILVTQGDWAKEAVETSFQFTVKGNQKDRGHAIVIINSREVLWFHTYHPSHFGGFNRQRGNCNGYELWRVLVRKFIRNHPGPNCALISNVLPRG